MKWISIVVLLILQTGTFAQTTAEWLRQKKTRIQYLTQQVAALEVYLVDLKKGYRTVRNGLGVIDNLKKGDFSLHNDYFHSLSAVDPLVANSDRVQGIFNLEKETAGISAAMHPLLSSLYLTASEKEYITAVMNNVLEKGSRDLDVLILVTTPGEADIGEEGRLKKIDALYEAGRDRYAFVMHFRQNLQLLLRSRAKEKQSSSVLYSLYGLK
ncbi:MAG: hypothetical protein INR73_27000 [Williamsia sp.]|nr:hypothetical protein [Williamsia sp.]